MPRSAGASSDDPDFDLEKGQAAAKAARTRRSAPKSSLPFKPLCLTFKDMRYSVPIPKVRHRLGRGEL